MDGPRRIGCVHGSVCVERRFFNTEEERRATEATEKWLRRQRLQDATAESIHQPWRIEVRQQNVVDAANAHRSNGTAARANS
jgi:hypothetical protein